MKPADHFVLICVSSGKVVWRKKPTTHYFFTFCGFIFLVSICIIFSFSFLWFWKVYKNYSAHYIATGWWFVLGLFVLLLMRNSTKVRNIYFYLQKMDKRCCMYDTYKAKSNYVFIFFCYNQTAPELRLLYQAFWLLNQKKQRLFFAFIYHLKKK